MFWSLINENAYIIVLDYTILIKLHEIPVQYSHHPSIQLVYFNTQNSSFKVQSKFCSSMFVCCRFFVIHHCVLSDAYTCTQLYQQYAQFIFNPKGTLHNQIPFCPTLPFQLKLSKSVPTRVNVKAICSFHANFHNKFQVFQKKTRKFPKKTFKQIPLF